VNLKPFDLEKALAGEPVVTRDGRTVQEVIAFKTPSSKYPVMVLIEGAITGRGRNGRFFMNSDTPHSGDLFMLGKETIVYVNLYQYPNSNLPIFAGTYVSKEEAERFAEREKEHSMYPAASVLCTSHPITIQS